MSVLALYQVHPRHQGMHPRPQPWETIGQIQNYIPMLGLSKEAAQGSRAPNCQGQATFSSCTSLRSHGPEENMRSWVLLRSPSAEPQAGPRGTVYLNPDELDLLVEALPFRMLKR